MQIGFNKHIYLFIPNTAVFGPTKLIETATASTAQHHGTDDSLWISKFRFLNLDF